MSYQLTFLLYIWYISSGTSTPPQAATPPQQPQVAPQETGQQNKNWSQQAVPDAPQEGR